VSPLPRHLASITLAACLLPGCALCHSWSCLLRSRFRRLPSFPLSPAMALPQPIQVLEPLPWSRSKVTSFALNELVNDGLLAPTGEGMYPAWMVPPASDMEPNPPYDYVVSFIRLHECAFTAPASRLMRGAVLPQQGGAPQFRAQCRIAGGHLCRRLLGVPRDPSELGSLGSPLPRGAPHPRHGRDAGASGGSRRRPDARAVGYTQGVVPTVHDDFKQRGLGEGVVLPPQRQRRPPTVHREGVDGEDRRLSPRCVTSRTAAKVGVAHHHSATPGRRRVLMVKIRQSSHEFTFGVGISFIPYPLVLTPVV
jgi:hypothetical protein